MSDPLHKIYKLVDSKDKEDLYFVIYVSKFSGSIDLLELRTGDIHSGSLSWFYQTFTSPCPGTTTTTTQTKKIELFQTTSTGEYTGDTPNKPPKNNDGRDRCFWCNEKTRKAGGGKYDVCNNRECEKFGV